MFSAIGKTVKIDLAEKVSYTRGIMETVKIYDGGILNFFYPDFAIKDKVYFNQNDKIIYVGKRKPNIKEYLQKRTRQFIDTVGEPADLDFTDRIELLNFVCAKWGYDRKEIYTDSDIQYLLKIDKAVFMSYVKQLWLSGKHRFTQKKDAISVRTIFKAIANRTNILPVIINIIEQHDEDYLESMLLLFLERAFIGKQVGWEKEGHYQVALDIIREKFSHEFLFTTLKKYRQMKKSKKMKLLWLFTLLSH